MNRCYLVHLLPAHLTNLKNKYSFLSRYLR